MIRLISALVLLSLLFAGYTFTSSNVGNNIAQLSKKDSCEYMKYDDELYETCLFVKELENTHIDVQIDIN